MLFEPAPRQAYQFGGNAFAFQVAHRLHGRILWHCENPARGTGSLFAVRDLGHDFHRAVVFRDPVRTGDASINVAVFYVAADLLRTDQSQIQVFILGARHVTPAAGENFPTRSCH